MIDPTDADVEAALRIYCETYAPIFGSLQTYRIAMRAVLIADRARHEPQVRAEQRERLEALRQRSVNAIGAGTSRRDWHATETAYSELRDGLDALLRNIRAGNPPQAGGCVSYQVRVDEWVLACFGEAISRDRIERNHRFIEEALEAVQANGCTRSEAHQLVDYVYDRPVGDLHQEVGGVMNTLAALCLASGIDMMKAAEVELARVWAKIEKIRAKHAAKPKHSPLLEHVSPSRSEDRT